MHALLKKVMENFMKCLKINNNRILKKFLQIKKKLKNFMSKFIMSVTITISKLMMIHKKILFFIANINVLKFKQ